MNSLRRPTRSILLALTAAAGFSLLSATNAGGRMQPEPKPAAPAKPAPQPAPAATEPLPSIDQVLEKSIEATGGKANWEKVKTTRTVTTFELKAMGITGKITLWVGENGKFLAENEIRDTANGQVGFDGETLWASDDIQGPRLIEGKERDAQITMAKFNNPLELKKLFSKIAVVGVEDVEGKPAYKVEGVVKAADIPLTLWFDKASGLTARMSTTVLSPQGEVPVDMVYADYKEVSGIKLAYLTTRKIMGFESIEKIEKFEVNPEIPANKFDLPQEIKDLKAAAKPAADKPAPATPPATPKPDKK